MLILKEVDTETAFKFFISDPKLSYIGLPDNDLAVLYHEGVYRITSDSCLCGIFEEDELVCILRWELFTDWAINLHYYLSSKFHHKKKLAEIFDFMKDFFLTKTEFNKAIIMAPSSCEHVIGPLEHFGFTLEGRITKCIKWRQELVDILIYGYILERGN